LRFFLKRDKIQLQFILVIKYKWLIESRLKFVLGLCKDLVFKVVVKTLKVNSAATT